MPRNLMRPLSFAAPKRFQCKMRYFLSFNFTMKTPKIDSISGEKVCATAIFGNGKDQATLINNHVSISIRRKCLFYGYPEAYCSRPSRTNVVGRSTYCVEQSR